MPYLLALIISFLPIIVKKVLALLGIGLVTYIGADFLMDQMSSLIISKYNNLGTDILRLMDLAGVHIAINMLLATFTSIVTLNAVKSSASVVMGGK